MIREERDPAFWARINLTIGAQNGNVDLAALLAEPRVKPLACDLGGYIFVQMDGLGRLWDLHAAFEPLGWGKVAAGALKASLASFPWAAIFATEVECNWRSRAPKSFGFRPAEPMRSGFRTWVLTLEAWEQSPARRRVR